MNCLNIDNSSVLDHTVQNLKWKSVLHYFPIENSEFSAWLNLLNMQAGWAVWHVNNVLCHEFISTLRYAILLSDTGFPYHRIVSTAFWVVNESLIFLAIKIIAYELNFVVYRSILLVI